MVQKRILYYTANYYLASEQFTVMSSSYQSFDILSRSNPAFKFTGYQGYPVGNFVAKSQYILPEITFAQIDKFIEEYGRMIDINNGFETPYLQKLKKKISTLYELSLIEFESLESIIKEFLPEPFENWKKRAVIIRDDILKLVDKELDLRIPGEIVIKPIELIDLWNIAQSFSDNITTAVTGAYNKSTYQPVIKEIEPVPIKPAWEYGKDVEYFSL